MLLLIASFFLLLALFLWYTAFKPGHFQRRSQKLRKPMSDMEASREIIPELPEKYDTDEVVVMVKDPYWLFAYWEVSEQTQQDFDRQAGQPIAWNKSQPVLRVYENTGSPEEAQFDVGINDWANRWYIKTGKPRATYFVELGRIFPDGRFFPLAKSNRVTTPPDDISLVIDADWPPLEAIWSSLVNEFSRTLPGEYHHLSSWALRLLDEMKKEEKNH
ncbi:MAG TPA: DUF4912 domain-containing protein [Clostridia bacterium]|jgi:hypothetical protein|nr:DUF4912 domain-containing protein [Clostridia bacterium]